jgi:hypothetical protein
VPFTLEDPWTKHARGIEHLETLARECDEYLGGVAFSAETVRDAQTGSTSIQFYGEPPPPRRLGTIVGDVVHNLRSALDVAAWQLGLVRDEDAARKQRHLVTFPLAERPARFKNHRALPFFTESARLVVERLQPYQTSMEALGWLRDLSNSDKHRIATYSFTGLNAASTSDVGATVFSRPRMLFGTDEGQIGLTGLQAIVATVEFALHELEGHFGSPRS